MPKNFLKVPSIAALGLAATTLLTAASAQAVSSAEFYTAEGYQYGRFEARVQFAHGDGVIGSYFLWKDGSEKPDVFWNELDFEKLGAECELETNAFYGDPEVVHAEEHGPMPDQCATFHTYVYEWTPEYVAWLVDGVEIRRETGDAALAYAENTPDGMQIRFNIWPGDATFGGNFDPAILPVHQYINWVQYSSYTAGAFQFEWREDFSGATAPTGWRTATWGSPKNLSTHVSANVSFVDGYAVLSLTADDATGPAGAAPLDPEGSGPTPAAPSGAAGAPGVPTSPTAAPTAPGTVSGMPLSPEDEMASDEGGGCRVHGAGLGTDWSWLVLALGVSLVRLRKK
jgi:endo-1,3-1,4-beta-glycanase ExoK